MKILLAICLIAPFLVAQEIFDRPCRTAEYMSPRSPFNPALYLGQWYEIERYEQADQAGTGCVTAYYTLNTNGTILVQNRGYIVAEGRFTNDTGLASISFPDESPLRAMLNVTFFPGRKF
jgi:apolipoprotein D and lipocalin family protein